jgi:PAS domain S-box-containing protein
MAVASQTALSISNANSFKKLQESEQKHRTLVETIRDIVYTIDLKGRFTYVSPMVANITGYADKELLGREFSDIVLRVLNPGRLQHMRLRSSPRMKSLFLLN